MHTSTLVWLSAALPLAFSQDSVSYDMQDYSAQSESPSQSYMSNANVSPPEMLVNKNGSGLMDGYIFIGVDGSPDSGQDWPTIFEFSDDIVGSLIWTGNYSKPFDFKASTYKGNPVLTFWSGELLDGYGRGSFYILDQSYTEIAHFQVANFGDNMGDIHEFEITADDTALVAIYTAIPYDLSPSGGPEDGWLFECTFQELNIETGELVFQWNSTTHVGIEESYNPLPSDVGTSEDAPWDYFHINSIEKDTNGDYLVSARVMDCVYKISGDDGSIIWRLNGKKSDFKVDPDAEFAFQHDARWVDAKQTRLTLFDNGPTDTIDYSRGLLLDVDQDAMTVKLNTEFTNSDQTFSEFEGSLQPIDPTNTSTNFLLGFGSQPYFAELDHNGNLLLDVQFGASNVVNSYRAFRQPWVGKPTTNPDIHWDKSGKSAYFSWNGATDIVSWTVLTAPSSNSSTWTNVTSAVRTGFETTIDLSDAKLDTFVRGKAVAKDGSALGWTLASNGNRLFEAPTKVKETGSVKSPKPTTSSSGGSGNGNGKGGSATRVTSPPSRTQGAESSSSSGAAARATGGVMGEVYVAAVVVMGGLAMV
ncbi:uncharacterized protein LTR77_001826 [Saxophila tyrrhenica]|uniref:ASST-domain-containing protein n=1 Tax=Saxophila tyrrhenica TaxID=1690608 RepID=A0AAV9PNZ1_9PEZI|nr:hypothetical protein LTR77_001826 [Saxophila tyrrhenica]